MPTVTKYANSISQTTGGNFRTFNNLNNLKNVNNSFAKSSSKLTAKNGSHPRPSTIICTNFGFNIPAGSRISKLSVEYDHQKLAHVPGKYPSIAKPNIILLGTNIPQDKTKSTITWGVAPTSTMQKHLHMYDGVQKQITNQSTGATKNVNYAMPTVSQVNSPNFGVRIEYPKNMNNYEGYMQLRYIRINIYYVEPQFTTIFEKISDCDEVVGNTIEYKLTHSDVSNTDYQDTITITLPPEVSYYNHEGSGVLSIDEDVLTWKPNKTNRVNELTLSVYLESVGSCTLSAVESYHNTTKTQSLSITPRPTGVISEIVDSELIVHTRYNEEFILPIEINETLLENCENVGINPSQSLQVFYGDEWVTVNSNNPLIISATDLEETLYLTCKTSNDGLTEIYYSLCDVVSDSASFLIKCLPDGIDYPSMVIYQVVDEELNRMADGFVYTVQSMLQLLCDQEDTELFEDYYRNFSIGVFNEPIPDDVVVDDEYIFDHTRHWSEAPGLFNTWESKTVNFTFNKDNPVYIIITSDFITRSAVEFQIQYTAPAVIESSVFIDYESPGNFPEPILNTLEADVPSEISVSSFKESNNIAFFDFPFENPFDTRKYAVRGIEFKMNVVADSRVVGLLKLKNEYGLSKERSVVIPSGSDGSFSIGGQFDSFGFKLSELSNFKDFEFDLQFQNLFSNETGQANIQVNNIQVVVHFIEIPESVSYFLVEGEDSRLYGVFLENADIPFGLETDTKFVDIDGTDLNDAYRMNIDKKKIELEINIYGCTVDESIQQLKELTKLLVNKRDELNRPIPKIIEFSFLPGEHFEYVMEDSIDPQFKEVDCTPKIKITIPAGTSFANEDTVTNYVGTVDGIAKVSPILQVIPLGTTIEITESEGVNNQRFLLSYSGLNSGSIVEIDCINQQVLLKKDEYDTSPIDITQYADYNVDWFKLHGDFAFETNGTCLIQTVTFNERG